MCFMRMLLPNSTVVPRRRRPRARDWWRRRSSAAPSKVAKACSQAWQRRRPSSVRVSFRLRRSSRGTPTRSSSVAMAWLTAEGVRWSRAAQAVKLPVCARVRKVRSWGRSRRVSIL